MTLPQAAVLASLAWLVVELVRGRRKPAMVFAAVAFAYVMLDYVRLDKALGQLTNSGLVAVVLLLLLSVVLDKSRMLEQMADRLVSGSYRWALAKLYVTTAAYSAFLNNTAAVASLLGPLRRARHHGPSRLLMPMCFAASLGGILTLIGTSTNLLVNSLMVGRGMPPLHIFDLFPVGILVVLACGLTMLVTCPHLLKAGDAQQQQDSDYFLEALVTPKSSLVGRTVQDCGLRNLAHLFLAEVVRNGHVIAPVAPDCVIQADDLLVFSGDITRLDLLLRFDGLETHGQHYRMPLDNLVEVVVAAHSTLVGRTIKEAGFRAQFDAAVIAVRRGSERVRGPLAQMRLAVGDTLVLVVGQDFDKRNNLQRNFVVVSRREVQKFTRRWHEAVATGAFVAAIALAALGVVDFLKALLVLLALYLLAGLARPGDLRRNMPYDIIIVIASSLVVSEVMLSTGTANLLAGALLLGAEQWGPYAALALILVVTWVLTELMSNNAAAALAFPVAVGVAQRLGLDPAPFVMATLYGASCSFLTPYGYQTNLMVMSPGRYTLGDFVRTGLPVALVFIAVTLVAVPVFFPFVLAR